MLIISKTEIDGISKISLRNRYDYFIKHVADMQEICILTKGIDDYFFDSCEGKLKLHMWNAIEFAESFLKNKNIMAIPVAISFDILGNQIYPMLKEKPIE